MVIPPKRLIQDTVMLRHLTNEFKSFLESSFWNFKMLYCWCSPLYKKTFNNIISSYWKEGLNKKHLQEGLVYTTEFYSGSGPLFEHPSHPLHFCKRNNNLVGGVPSQCIHISNHHVVYFIIQFYFSITPQ